MTEQVLLAQSFAVYKLRENVQVNGPIWPHWASGTCTFSFNALINSPLTSGTLSGTKNPFVKKRKCASISPNCPDLGDFSPATMSEPLTREGWAKVRYAAYCLHHWFHTQKYTHWRSHTAKFAQDLPYFFVLVNQCDWCSFYVLRNKCDWCSVKRFKI